MKNLEIFEKKYLEKIKETKKIPDFNPGDTLTVYVKVKEKKRERDQAFEGVCIAKKKAGINSSFTFIKVSYGEGVERVFPLYSPMLESIKLIRKGKVRRSKLYYLRQRSGKSARIAEKKDLTKKEDQKLTDDSIEKKGLDVSSKKDSGLKQKTQKFENQKGKLN